MGTLEVDKLDPQSGTALEIGTSGDTVTVPSGVTLTVAGALNVTGTTALADGTVNVAELDIDGATDIGEAIVDADLFVIDNGAGGTNRKTAASRLKTFILADNSLDSDMYVDGSIDTAHIANDQITAALMADNSIDSDMYVDGSIDTAHIGATQVTGAKLAADVISAQTALTAERADTDEFMVSDAGVLKRIDYSLIKGGGITHASYWRLSVALQGDAVPISSNWEEYDDASYERIGSAMTESSGVFTFPETGKWRIHFFAEQTTDSNFAGGTSASRGQWEISLTQNTGSSWDAQAVCTGFGGDTSGAQGYVTVSCEALFDVTNTSTHKCRFSVDQIDGNNYTMGNSSTAYTGMAFVRYGDT